MFPLQWCTKLLDVDHHLLEFHFQVNKLEGAMKLSCKNLTICNFLNFEQVKQWITMIIIESVVLLCQKLIIITLGIWNLLFNHMSLTNLVFCHGMCYEKHNFHASFWVHCIVVLFSGWLHSLQGLHEQSVYYMWTDN